MFLFFSKQLWLIAYSTLTPCFFLILSNPSAILKSLKMPLKNAIE